MQPLQFLRTPIMYMTKKTRLRCQHLTHSSRTIRHMLTSGRSTNIRNPRNETQIRHQRCARQEGLQSLTSKTALRRTRNRVSKIRSFYALREFHGLYVIQVHIHLGWHGEVILVLGGRRRTSVLRLTGRRDTIVFHGHCLEVGTRGLSDVIYEEICHGL